MSSVPLSSSERSNQRYIAATMAMPMLESETEVELARRWSHEKDEDALHQIIESHTRLAVAIASRFRGSGLPLADLIQEGSVGLMEAAKRFDPDRGVRFSTYASWWILYAVQNYVLRNSSIVRTATTPRQRRLFFNMRRLKARYATGYDGRLSTDDHERIAKELGATAEEVARMEAHISRPDQSLNATIGDDDSPQQQDLLPEDGPNPEDIAIDAGLGVARQAWIERALAGLTPREQHIVRHRYLTERGSTLAEIGETFGVSKERIRQVEARALEKMRSALTSLIDRPEDMLPA
jgi:RNA polymerase sigma-32 factor